MDSDGVTKYKVLNNNGAPVNVPVTQIDGIFTHQKGVDVTEAPKSAQGNSTPPQFFANHFIVKYNGKYYDPSYGIGGYNGATDWENAALDGFIATLIDPNNSSVKRHVVKPNSVGVEVTFTEVP